MFATVDKKRTNNMIFGRIIIIIAVQLFLIFYSFIYAGIMDKDKFNILTIINIFSLMSCVMAFKAVEKEFKSVLLNVLLVIFDSAYMIALIALTGYNNSPFILLLPVYIFFTSLTFRVTGTVFSTILSIGLILLNYRLDKNTGQNPNYVITLSSVMFLFALITRYFIEKASRTTEGIKELNKLNRLLIGDLDLGIININRKGSISSINRTAGKILKGKDNASSMLARLIDAASREPHRLEVGDAHIFIYKIETPQGTTLVIKDISDDDKIDKLKFVNTIASILAHEIKNPVSSIAGVSELIQTDRDILLDQGQKEKLLGIIDRESSRLTSLVEEFLIYSGSEKRKNEEINVNALVQNSCDNARVNREFVEKGIGLEFAPDESSVCKVHGDFQRLTQAFDNIFINAVQACGKKGQITCSVKCNDGKVQIHITNDGAGIPDEIKTKIFEPFFTTKEKGTGLGLAIVSNIIAAHDGKIELQQNKQGTTFSITFPNRS
jgi:signal transduction histidine kinase